MAKPNKGLIDLDTHVANLINSKNPNPKILKTLLGFEKEARHEKRKQKFLKALANFQNKFGILESDNIVKFTNRATGQEGQFVMPTINHLKAHISEKGQECGLLFTTSTRNVGEGFGQIMVEVTIAHEAGYTKNYSRLCSVSQTPQIDSESEIAAAVSKCEKSILIKALGISVKSTVEGDSGKETLFLEDFMVDYPVTLGQASSDDSGEEGEGTMSKGSIINKINKVAAKNGVKIEPLKAHLKVKGLIRNDLDEVDESSLDAVIAEIDCFKNSKPVIVKSAKAGK